MGFVRLEVDVLVRLSSWVSILVLPLLFSTMASASFKRKNCHYLSDYSYSGTDIRVQNYLNFYVNKGMGKPYQIQVPGCISNKQAQLESELKKWERDKAKALQTVDSEGKKRKDKKAVEAEWDSKKPTMDTLPSLSGHFKSADTSYKYKVEYKDPETKKMESKELSCDTGTATFCKGMAICELDEQGTDDTVTSIENVYCKAKDSSASPSSCPTADECFDDMTVSTTDFNELRIEGDAQFEDGRWNQEGEQTPTTAPLGR